MEHRHITEKGCPLSAEAGETGRLCSARGGREITLSFAAAEDAEALLGIYRHYVTDTAISFETDAPSAEDFAERIKRTTAFYPWLVCRVDGRIVGYAYASRHRERGAYRWSADLSVYIAEPFHRCGMASALYTALCRLLRMQGLCTVYAGVTCANPVSEAFHRSFGFRAVGTYENVGFKQGKWWGVTWFELPLGEYPAEPLSPVPFPEIMQDTRCLRVAEEAARLIRL